MRIDVNILRSSAAALDADVVDFSDESEVLDAAFVVASNIVNSSRTSSNEYMEFFKSYVNCGNIEVAKAMSEATNIDWLYDTYTEALFIKVVRNLIEGIVYYSANEKT